jgi:hypothetical protein
MKKIIITLFVLAVLPVSITSQPYFQKITSGQIVLDINSNNNCSWVDFDNDGDLDMVTLTYL